MTTWKIEFNSKAKKEFNNLNSFIRKRIEKFLEKLSLIENPKQIGHALTGNFTGHWRYRIGDYRIVCEINEDIITIKIVRVQHRKDVYKKEIA